MVATLLLVGSGLSLRLRLPWQHTLFRLASWLTAAASRAPRMKEKIGYLIVGALSWIAPFYGFFHGPSLLGQGLVLACDGRPLASVILAAAGMLIAAEAG